MAIFPQPKLIKSSDFPQENQEFATSLGNIINTTLEQIYTALNNGIDFNNLNQQLVTFSTNVTAAGVPKSKLEVKTSLKTKIQGTVCVKVEGNSFPTSNPLISFTYSSTNGSIIISHITGLVADTDYNITAILIG